MMTLLRHRGHRDVKRLVVWLLQSALACLGHYELLDGLRVFVFQHLGFQLVLYHKLLELIIEVLILAWLLLHF